MQQHQTRPNQWFSFLEQKITGIQLAHQIAANHADVMTPEQVVEYVVRLNDVLFQRLIKG